MPDQRTDPEGSNAEAPEAELQPVRGNANSNLTVYYVKSPAFRTIHVDGVFGGPTPTGAIQLAFFSERLAIPIEQDLVVDPEGVVLGETGRRGKRGFVRELEVNTAMDLRTAEVIRDWLAAQIERLKKLEGEQSSAGEKL